MKFLFPWYDQWMRSPCLRLLRPWRVIPSRLVSLQHGKAGLLALIALTLWLVVTVPGFAQEAPSQETTYPKPDEKPAVSVKSPVLTNLESLAPPDIQSLLTGSAADVSTAPVRLDGRTLFRVAAPAVGRAANGQLSLSAQQRAQEIERRLYDLLDGSLSPENLDVSQDFDQQSNQPIIRVNGEFLSTITSLDAQINGYSNPALTAQNIARSVEAGLKAYFDEREPDYLWQQARWAGAIALLSICLYLGLGVLKGRSAPQKKTDGCRPPLPPQKQKRR